jgi:hypothetical protein
MTRFAGNPRAPIERWNAEMLRFSLFLAPGENPDTGNWWRNVTNSEPESSETKPRLGLRVDTGIFRGGLLVMQFQGNRVDWIYVDRPDARGELELRDLAESLTVFTGAMDGWLPRCPSVVRLAFGATLLCECQSRDETYRFLSDYLTFDLDSENSSDFSYQINRSRVSRTLPGLWINRLTKWSAMRNVLGGLTLREDPSVISLSPIAMRHAARLEIDINTSVERTDALPDDVLGPIYAELVRLGIEIVQEGDVP